MKALPAVKIAPEAARYLRLPFVTLRPPEGPLCFWSPRPSGNYTADNHIGHEYAEALLRLAAERGEGAFLLTNLAVDMMEFGDAERDKGIVVGMMRRLGRSLAAPVAPAVRPLSWPTAA